MPDGITDRPADVWEPLLAVADVAGGDWPRRACEACVTLVKASQTNDKGSIGVRLLTDLRDHVLIGIDRLPTVAILDRLNALDDAPWADFNGRPLDSRRLSQMLGEYVTADGTPVASRNTPPICTTHGSATAPRPRKVRYLRYPGARSGTARRSKTHRGTPSRDARASRTASRPL